MVPAWVVFVLIFFGACNLTLGILAANALLDTEPWLDGDDAETEQKKGSV